MPDERRPDPDQILQGIKKLEEKRLRGRLKVFFGMCPGVGKTFSMLEAAKEQQNSGVKVVVGLVETHDRPETKRILQGLTVLPRKKIEYRGTVTEEMDLDLLLQQKPELVVVDELAHTNAPGLRHPKRYQDVEELLNAGINVYSTLNVQHIESRADLVYQITSVPVRETVPDSFLQLADQIELIDLTPDDLLKRMSQGNVYMGERAERAAKGFFKEENLSALRELALRFTAEKVDDQLREQMTAKRILGPWNTNERLMVAISQSPYSARLIRSTRRMAFNLEAPWIALYVDTGQTLSTEDHEMLVKNMALAKELGAELITTRDSHVSDALKRIASEKNVTQLVMGRPDRRMFRDALSRGTILDQLVRETSEIDIHIIRQERKPVYRGFHLRLPEFSSNISSYLNTLWFLLFISMANFQVLPFIGYKSVGFVYLMAVLIVSNFTSLGPILFAAFFSTLAWDYLFIPPQFTFYIRSGEDIMMCVTFFAVAIVAGLLARRIRRQESDLIQREQRANILYDFGRELNEAKGARSIAMKAGKIVERIFSSSVAILLTNEQGELIKEPLNYCDKVFSDKDLAVADWSFKNRKKAGWRTETLFSSRCLCLPLMGLVEPIGVLVLFPVENKSLSLDQENLLDTIASHLAIALEREGLQGRARDAEILKKSEKLHQALLNSVSHELRTPLTAIVGASTALSDAATVADPAKKSALVDDLMLSTMRLNRIVENLLDMSRINSGALSLKKDIFELNDFLRSVLQTVTKLASQHKIHFQAGEDAIIFGDDRLLEHAVFNLLSNAIQYSPIGSEIKVELESNAEQVFIHVQDEGPGIPIEAQEKIFDRFYRIPGTPAGGTGLGLSIVKAIVEASGGRVMIKNRNDRGGSVFTIQLPRHKLPADFGERSE